MTLNNLYSAQCSLERAKAEAFRIYRLIIDEEKTRPLSRSQEFTRGQSYRRWGLHKFHESTDLDSMTIEIEQFGVEQDLCRTVITLRIDTTEYCRGEYYESDEIVIPDWLFDDPSPENITRFVAEMIAELDRKIEAERQKQAGLREDARAKAEIKRRERFAHLKRVFEKEEMIDERLEYESLKKEFEPEKEEEKT